MENVKAVPELSRARAVGAGWLAGIAAAAVALAFGEFIDGASDTIPSLVVAVGEVLVDYSPDWAVRLSIEIFGENDKTALAIGIVAVSLIIGGLLGANALAPRLRWVPLTAFAAFGCIGGWSAARNPMSPFVGSWVVAMVAALLGYIALRLLLRLAPLGSIQIISSPASGGTGERDLTSRDPASREGAASGALDNATKPSSDTHLDSGPHTEPDTGAHSGTKSSRRAFLSSVVGAGAVAVGFVALGRAVRGQSAAETARAAINLNRPTPPTSTATASTAVQPTATSAAQQTTAARVAALNTLDEVEGISSYVTPNNDFYRIDTALTVPQVDPADWKLSFTGMVENPYELTFDEILAMDLQEHVITLSCVSNSVGGNLVGNAVWTGVPLVDLLDRAGVQEGADQVVGRSVDDWTAGFPTEILRDGRNAVLAVGMNGEPLPTRHGFPARLVVAGLYGYVSAVKWVEEIRLTTWEGFDGYWVPRGWSKRGPIKTQSRIDVPGGRDRPVAGVATAIAGIAWAPTRGISAVEVRIDDGPWRPCELGEALGDESWVQWHHRWIPTAGTHSIQVRATDGTGAIQPEGPVDVRPDGAEGWHRIAVRVDAA